MTVAIERARADLEAGRHWKARERLRGLLTDRQDVELLDLLAGVHYAMHDLPAAGALWFVTERDDEMAQDAIAAWRERHGNDEARWHSIPGPVRHSVHTTKLRSLKGAAEREMTERRRPGSGSLLRAERWWQSALSEGGPVVFLLCWLALTAVGAWTVVHWIWG